MNGTWLDTIVLPWQRSALEDGPAGTSRKDTRFMHLPQASIRYRIAGNRPKTIVFATDPPVVVEHYDELIERLSPHFRVVVLELPAFGFSYPRFGVRFDIDSGTEIVKSFLEKLGHGPYVLAFPCASAYIAIMLAGWHPRLVSELVIIQAPDWHEELKWKHSRDPKNILGKPVIGQILMALLKKSRVGAWYRLALADKTRVPEFLGPTLDSLQHGARFSLASSFQEYLTGDEPNFKTVEQPTMIVWGLSDRSHPNTDRDSAARYARNSRIEYLQQTGHFPELECPESFSNLLLDFLSEKTESAIPGQRGTQLR